MFQSDFSRRSLAIVATCFILAACTTTTTTVPGPTSTTAKPISPEDVSAPQTWGAATNVTTLKFLSFSEQPDAEALRVAKSNGITTVVNLRDQSEMDWDERAAVEGLGLKYVNIPITKSSDTLDPAAIAAIGDVIKQQNGSPVLLHCSSGNRVAAWLATHLIDDHKMSEEDALPVARQAGLTSKKMEKRVLNYTRR